MPLEAVGRILSHILDFAAPPACAACDVPLLGGAALCGPCAARSGAPLVTTLFDEYACAAAGSYDGPLGEAVRRLKYGMRPDLARPLGRLVAAAIGQTASLDGETVLVPVPLHPTRLCERGFNQAALVADSAGRCLGVRALSTVLVRHKRTEEQAQLGGAERLHNVRAAFGVRPGFRLSNVILVDDVITTGATIRACIDAIEREHITVAAIACVARADRTAHREPM